MNRTPKTAMVAGAAGGYLLGRTKKGKLALVVGLALLARRLGIAPQDLARKGVEQASEMPEFAKLADQVRDEFMEAARTALTSTVNRRIDGLSETLRARTEELAEVESGNGGGGNDDGGGGGNGDGRGNGDGSRTGEGDGDGDEKSASAEEKQESEPKSRPASERQRANGREPARAAKARR